MLCYDTSLASLLSCGRRGVHTLSWAIWMLPSLSDVCSSRLHTTIACYLAIDAAGMLSHPYPSFLWFGASVLLFGVLMSLPEELYCLS